MAKNFILKCMLAASIILPAGNLLAKGNTPVETFVNSVKQTNKFVSVSSIWQPDNNFDQSQMLKVMTKGQPMSIDYMALAGFMKQKTTAISLVLPGIGGGTYTVDLARYDFLTNDFEVHSMGANNNDQIAEYTPGLYYRGVVNGIPGSVAAFSFFNNEVYGIFSIPGEGNYVVTPNTMVGSDYDFNPHYLLYNDEDLTITDLAPSCGSDRLPAVHAKGNKTTTNVGNKVFNNCTEVRCFETADYAMYVKKGNSVTNATNYITALFNNKSTLYRNEGIPISLKYVQVNTATDAYQSLALNSGTWLNKFGDVTMNTMHGCDVATLFSTKADASGFAGMGGVAWLGLLCNPYIASQHAGPYAFCNIDNTPSLTPDYPVPTYSWDVEVSTHEMGHSVGSPHTHACVWNPPARNTAIDSCYTIEGSCIAPAGRPSGTVKGTIMSYCHLIGSIGINLANGFGPQPGDTIRYYLAHTFGTDCGADYSPTTALQKAARTITANRECTDLTGTTYYWYDNNTANHTDDSLVLMIVKNGNNIGTLDSGTFAVSATTDTTYGNGSAAVVTFPTATIGIVPAYTQYSMKRYWKITPYANPTTAVEVIYPFTSTDTTDVSGSIAGPSPLIRYKMYKANSPVNPDPAGHFTSAVAANFTIYTYAATPSTTNWSWSSTGTTQFAHMKMTNLSGGGSGFYSYSPTGVEDVNGSTFAADVYPNPTSNDWYITAGANNGQTLSFQLFTADGRLVQAKMLQSGLTNVVSAANLATGMYYYRIVGGTNVYTGSLMRN